jgi:magnesium-transporting ATPase (P-type)
VSPLSSNNPNRNRNYVILIVACVIIFAIVMASFVTLSIAGSDTDSYIRFLTLLVTTLVPSALSAIMSTHAARNARDVKEDVQQVKIQLNGDLDKRIVSAVQVANTTDPAKDIDS